MEPTLGFEPKTSSLPRKCSAAELCGPGGHDRIKGVVGREGIEPPQSKTADLQSAELTTCSTYPRTALTLRDALPRGEENDLRSFLFSWSRRRDSNPEPAVYKTAALPIELRRRRRGRIPHTRGSVQRRPMDLVRRRSTADMSVAGFGVSGAARPGSACGNLDERRQSPRSPGDGPCARGRGSAQHRSDDGHGSDTLERGHRWPSVVDSSLARVDPTQESGSCRSTRPGLVRASSFGSSARTLSGRFARQQLLVVRLDGRQGGRHPGRARVGSDPIPRRHVAGVPEGRPWIDGHGRLAGLEW
jgi:hypothetical protein